MKITTMQKLTALIVTAALTASLGILVPRPALAAEGDSLTAGTMVTAGVPIAYKTKTVNKTYGAAKFTHKLTVNTTAKVTYGTSNKKVATVDGSGKVTIKGVGSATIKATVAKTATAPAATTTYKLVIAPRAVSCKSLKATATGFKATWAKGKTEVTGYQVKYSKFRDLSSAKTVKVSKRATVSAKLKKQKGPANCFASVRSYAKGKDGKTYYSAWSKPKQVIGALNSGDKTLDANVKAILKKTGTGDKALKKAFDYVVALPYKSSSTAPKGNWSVKAAKAMYKNKGGNCYDSAALFAWVAKGLGYNANAVGGKFVNVKKDGTVIENPHGWVEIKVNGKISYCDPNTTTTCKKNNLNQIRGYSTYLYMVKSGQPYGYKK